MTKTYKYEYTRYIRDNLKAGYAASRINEDLRNKYGYKKSVVRAWDLKEIKRK